MNVKNAWVRLEGILLGELGIYGSLTLRQYLAVKKAGQKK